MDLARSYARFRGTTRFLYLLVACLIGIVLAHDLFGFDPDWGITNLALSMEASVSVALLIMAEDKQDAARRKQLEYMLNIMNAMISEAEAAEQRDLAAADRQKLALKALGVADGQ